MNIPSRQSCFDLIRTMGMLDNIVDHSIMVCRVATALSGQFLERGVKLHGKLIETSALLHDITKTRSFQTGEKHNVTGCRLLREMGYPEVGDIIRQHVILDRYDFSGAPSEVEIVNYADKRVLHDGVVSLGERMAYIYRTYGIDDGKRRRIREGGENMRKVEAKLFSYLPFPPEALEEVMETVHPGADKGAPAPWADKG